MSRRSLLVALMLLIGALAIPAASRADHECDVLPEDAGFMCSSAGIYRSVDAALTSRTAHVSVFGFEITRVNAPKQEAVEQGVSHACLEAGNRKMSFYVCGVPLTVTIDPLLETATIKGAFVDRKYGVGKVVVDLTVTADAASGGAMPYAAEGVRGACGTSSVGGALITAERTGSTSGYVSFQRGLGKLTANEDFAFLHEYAAGGTTVLTPEPCAEEDDEPVGFFSCYGVGVDSGGACVTPQTERSVRVTARSRSATVVVTGSQTLDPSESAYWLPEIVAPGEASNACVLVRTKGSGFQICSFGGGPYDGIDVEVDPLLRTATIRGTIASFPFYGPPGFQAPPSTRTGNIALDLVVTQSGPLERDTERFAAQEISCGALDVAASTGALKTAATATGMIGFQRSYGTFRGNASRPLGASMALSGRSYTLVDTGACAPMAP